jgi:hypothetical protein
MDKWHRWGHYGCRNISREAEDDDIFVRLKDVEERIRDEHKTEKAEIVNIKQDEWVCRCGLKSEHVEGPACHDIGQGSVSLPYHRSSYLGDEPKLIGGEWWYPFKGYPK